MSGGGPVATWGKGRRDWEEDRSEPGECAGSWSGACDVPNVRLRVPDPLAPSSWLTARDRWGVVARMRNARGAA